MSDAPKINILLVDDDKFLLDMYSMKFVQRGYNVQSSLSASDAIDCLRQGYVPDAIVFDITMPEHDGFWFLQTLESEKLAHNAKKIALTNQSSDSEKTKAKELGADIYIVKATMIPSEVVNTVAGTIGTPVSP
ncbi:MAG TPA: response regulator [Candidatus Paceibacterota bacterium]